MKAHFHKTQCPQCGKINDAHCNMDKNDFEDIKKSVESRQLVISLCTGCGKFNAFTEDLQLRPLTAAEELEALNDAEDGWKMQVAKAVHASVKKEKAKDNFLKRNRN